MIVAETMHELIYIYSREAFEDEWIRKKRKFHAKLSSVINLLTNVGEWIDIIFVCVNLIRY